MNDTSFLLKTFHKNPRPLLVLQEISSYNYQQSNFATAIKPKQNYFLPQKKPKTSNTSTQHSQKLFPIFEKYDSYSISIKKTHHRNRWQLREQKVVLFYYYYIYKPKTKLGGGGGGLNWEPPFPSAFLPSVPVSCTAQYAICMVLALPGALGFRVPWRLSTGRRRGINKLIIPPSTAPGGHNGLSLDSAVRNRTAIYTCLRDGLVWGLQHKRYKDMVYAKWRTLKWFCHNMIFGKDIKKNFFLKLKPTSCKKNIFISFQREF